MVMFGNYGKLSNEARNYLDYTLKEFQCLNKVKGAKNMITYKEGLEIIQMIKDKYLLSFKASISLITITKEYCIYKIHAVVENKKHCTTICSETRKKAKFKRNSEYFS